MFYYYGGKARNAHRYPAPRYPLIVEPFAGSAGYGVHHLCRDPGLRLLLVEKDPRVVALWRRLLAATPEEIEGWPIPPVGETTTDRLVMQAAASNATAHTTRMRVSERIRKEGLRQRAKIARAMRLCRGRITVVEGDYTDAPDVAATWYVDPPYQVPPDYAGKARHPAGLGYAKGCDARALDYAALARWVHTRRGDVIVCEYATATWLDFRPLVTTTDGLGRCLREGIFYRRS